MTLDVVIAEDNAIDYLVHAYYTLDSELDSLEYFVKKHDSYAFNFFENCEYYAEAAKQSLKILADNDIKFPDHFVSFFTKAETKIGQLRNEWNAWGA